MIKRLKRLINRTRHGNPYGKPHSINVLKLDGFPLPPESLVLLAEQTIWNIDECNGNDFDKLRLIYDYLDEYNQFVQTFSVCKRGCSHCCKIDVAVTKLEALYIEKQTGSTMNRKRKFSTNHRDVCPMLLADGVCRIYEYRPFNCRTFHTLDSPDYCATPGVSHVIYGVANHKVSYQSGCYKMMKDKCNSLNQTKESKDIRDYFSP